MDNNELQFLRTKLKSGEYDGADIMHAWMAIDELLEARANQGAAVAAERERLCAALSLAMQHSAFEGVLQLDDALRNIDDVLRA